MGRVATLLLIAGLAALIVEHKLPAQAAYGMIGLGIAGVATMAVLHWRHHHRQQPEQVS
jgi:NAD/NADP transhydrogenase beta subunit